MENSSIDNGDVVLWPRGAAPRLNREGFPGNA